MLVLINTFSRLFTMFKARQASLTVTALERKAFYRSILITCFFSMAEMF